MATNPKQMRDDECYRSLAEKPDYGKNDWDEPGNPIDLSEGAADDLMEDREQQIDGKPDKPNDDYD